MILHSPDLVQDFTPIFRYDGDSVILGDDANTSFDLTNGIITYQDANAPVGRGFYRFQAEVVEPEN